jgi:hypothetical protein
MKKIIILLSLFLFENYAYSQTDDFAKIAISAVMPENVDGLSAANLSKLETKIIQILTTNGIGASGYNYNFVIYPVFEIYESKAIEGGMENLLSLNCQLNLFIKNSNNNMVFASINKTLKGIGNDKQSALTNVINKINIKDADFQTFIETGKIKIISYYESNCGDIITKSESLVKMQDYEQALGLLMTVPEEVSCYNQVQEKSIEAYKAYQKQKCIVQLQEAKTQLAANNYNDALNILGQIDPSTPCFRESQTLIVNTAAKVDQEEKKQWEFQMKVYEDNIALEKRRIKAVRDIAVAYYKRKPRTVNYIYLIR